MLEAIIRFDWSFFISFFCGIVTGFIILFLIYLLYILINIKKKNKLIITKEEDKEEKALERIIATKQAFKDKKTKGSKSITYTYNLCTKLIVDTARDFYPNSKHPLFELSISEILQLSEYIRLRIDEMLDYKGLRILKKVKVSTILNMADAKKVIEENEIVKATKKYRLKTTYQAAKKVINLVNPLWWAKKLVIDGTFNILINKLCVVVIGIVGEETYKIYSKKVFEVSSNIDSLNQEELDNLVEEDILNEEES